MTAFGYVPDYRGKSPLKDIYLKIFGYPYPPRRNEAALVFNFLRPEISEKILDIGCGDGIWYLELLKKGISVAGLDTSSHDLNKLLERAKMLNLKPEIMRADAQKMPFADNTFDKIYSISTFEHIKDDENVFGEAKRVSKPNGLMVISVPLKKVPLFTKIAVRMPRLLKKIFCNEITTNAKNENDYLDNFSKYHFHCRNYTMEDMKERCLKYGFRIEEESYNCRFWGSLIWSLYHTLKVFERHKSSNTDYKFRNEAIYALVAPIFYLMFLFDRLLFWKKGQIIILKLRKK